MTEENIINKFWGKYRFLSNFYKTKITIDGKEYPSTEHYFQAMKFSDEEVQEKIRTTPKPSDAKKLAHKFKAREDWWNISKDIMEKALMTKFSLPNMKEKLLETGNKILQEGNTWGDTFWGIDIKTGEGENNLGKLLMKVREKLRTNQ